MGRRSGTNLLVAAVLASLFAEPARAEARSVAIIVARGPGLAATLTKGLALKLALEAQRRRTVMGLKLGLHDMGDKEWQKKMDERKVKGWLVEGGPSDDGSGNEMASLSKLPAEQVDALIAHVRTFGN